MNGLTRTSCIIGCSPYLFVLCLLHENAVGLEQGVIVDKFAYFEADLLLYFSSVKLASNMGEIGPREKILAPIQPEGAESESV